jgi:hypothetical protein
MLLNEAQVQPFWGGQLMKTAITLFATAASILATALFVRPASAGNLDHCPSIDKFGPQTTPHCVQQREFCVAWSMVPIDMLFEAKRFEDPRDVIADLFNGTVFADAAAVVSSMEPQQANTIATNVIAWAKAHHYTWKGNIGATVRDDCIAGTIDFLDNDGP